MEIQRWMSETKAKKIMVQDVVTLRPGDPLFQAASTLLRGQISGVPVVDEAGICVGVISASDFLDAEEIVAKEREEVAESSFFTSNLALPPRVYAEKLAEVRDKIAPAAEQPIEHFMTTDLVTAEEDTPLSKVIQYMVDGHVHRVLILGPDKRLVGIISTTDVLAALLRVGGMVGLVAEP